MSHQSASVDRRRHTFIIFGVVSLLIIAGVGITVWLGKDTETTDDAFIDGHIVAISPQIAGRVEQVNVKDNQHVLTGQILISLDKVDRQNALQNAQDAEVITKSKLEENKAQLVALQASLKKARANMHVAEVNFQRDTREYQRYRNSGSAVSHSELDARAAQAQISEATLHANQQEVNYRIALLREAESTITSTKSILAKNHTAVELAQIQLSRTQIVAPIDGYVTKRTVEPGNVINENSILLYLVSDNVWVTANFKESQLRYMRAGQPVNITVDAWPNHSFKANIDSLQRATGSVFNLLPPENATGNYVKIVQRVPVKIVFNDPSVRDFPLSPGMSVIPNVDISH